MQPPSPIFRFGPYESRPRTRELLKHGSRLKIRPQPLQILNLLLSRAGDVVTREELRQELWTSDTFVDFERGLNSAVMALRAVLGGRDKRFSLSLARGPESWPARYRSSADRDFPLGDAILKRRRFQLRHFRLLQSAV
jgi:hypothetical protein